MVWSINDKVIDTYKNDRYEEVTTEIADSIVNILKIKNVQKSDFIEYNCSAKNQYGSDSDVVKLRQLGNL